MDSDPEGRIDPATHRALVGARLARARALLVGIVLAGSLSLNVVVFVGALVEERYPHGERDSYDAYAAPGQQTDVTFRGGIDLAACLRPTEPE